MGLSGLSLEVRDLSTQLAFARPGKLLGQLEVHLGEVALPEGEPRQGEIHDPGAHHGIGKGARRAYAGGGGSCHRPARIE